MASKHSKHSINTTSNLSLKSAKSVVEKLPKTRVCPWVAKWFTLSQAVVKSLEFMVGVSTVVLMLLWQSGDITIADLNSGSVNYRNRIYWYTGVGILTILYSLGMTVLGLSGMKAPSVMLAAFSGVMLLIWILSAPVMSVSLKELDDSLFARSRDLDTLYLQIATGLGFFLLATFLADILLAFLELNNLDEDSKQFAQELSQSRSTLMAIRSGKSLDEVKASHKRSKTSRSSSTAAAKPVDETSPLKAHEEPPDDIDIPHSSV